MEHIHTGTKARPKPKQSSTLLNSFFEIGKFIFNLLIRIITGIEQPNFLRWMWYGTNQRFNVEEGTRTCCHYKVPLSCWPRIQKSQPLIRNLSERCSCILEQTFGWQKEPINHLHEIDIYIDSNVQTDVRQLLDRVNTFKVEETVSLRVYEKNMPTSCSLHINFSGIFIGKEGVTLVENATSERIDVVTVDVAGDESIYTDISPTFTVQQKSELKSLLECVVFENLIVQYEKLNKLYSEICNNNVADDFAKTRRSTIEQLLGEMTTMFKRSTLPKHKMPVLFCFEKQQVSKEVTRQLFRIDETIRACGFSNSTFNVNVESLSNEDEETDRNKRIKEFLANFGVTNVKFNTVSKDVSEYTYVGAEVIAKKNYKGTEITHQATIGGFASMEHEHKQSTCVLISRHLGMGCKENKLYVNSNGHQVEFGNIDKGTLYGEGYDIAAAKVHDHYASSCDVRYKNSENVPLPGKLKSDLALLQNLPVHLWGAKSKPGFGIITIPDLYPSDKNGSYMQIEDREPPVNGQSVQRMAVEGDSGAVICADDLDDEHVNVIAMFIGSNNREVTKKSPDAKGTYVAFPLQEGVKRLDRKNYKFSLQGISNN